MLKIKHRLWGPPEVERSSSPTNQPRRGMLPHQCCSERSATLRAKDGGISLLSISGTKSWLAATNNAASLLPLSESACGDLENETMEAQAHHYIEAVERLRLAEYPMLRDAVYLDHAGATLYPKSLIDRFAAEMIDSLLGNPHSASPSSQAATAKVDDARLAALQLFKADPNDFDLIFVQNTTAGIKLVADSLSALPGGFDYVYHEASHTSLVGVRQLARQSLCVDNAGIDEIMRDDTVFSHKFEGASNLLIAYPGQSNMSGERFPTRWAQGLRCHDCHSSRGIYTMLDAAALAATSPLDFSQSELAPDFTVVSFQKIFGFPDLAGLVVRRQAESAFASRKFFGGGTVEVVMNGPDPWHALKNQVLHERLEDGTLPFHNILALGIAIDVHRRLFGSMTAISQHVRFLTQRCYAGLEKLSHANGQPVCMMHSGDTSAGAKSGPTIAFNLRTQAEEWVSLAEFEKLAALKNFHIRTGGVCNPGGVQRALGYEIWEVKKHYWSGYRCGTDNDAISAKPTGIMRVSFGAMSTISDVDKFVAFIAEFYQETCPIVSAKETEAIDLEMASLRLQSITVFPIKSCAGFTVPAGTSWEVRPEGLAWDREWCLLHRGSGQALSQKSYPRMALLRPVLDFDKGYLRVTVRDDLLGIAQKELRVPLASNAALFRRNDKDKCLSTRVCGDEILAKTYISEEINDFFSTALGVPCVLARFPPGGQGRSMRHAKAHMQKYQKTLLAPDSGTPPSPPDSDVETETRNILLSNESPILAINMASVRALNRELVAQGGLEISPDVFRANLMIDQSDTEEGTAYIEDQWSRIRIGSQEFEALGACRRCHMVCINQETAVKSQEPFVTLSKTRRFDGKVFFGIHMGHLKATNGSRRFAVEVGDAVVVE